MCLRRISKLNCTICINQLDTSFHAFITVSLFQVRRAVVLEVEIVLKVTMMIGQDMDLILPPIVNQLATLQQTLPKLPESRNETGPSGTETTDRDGLNLPPFSTISPCFLCWFYLLWLLLPPCGDSRTIQPRWRLLCQSSTS